MEPLLSRLGVELTPVEMLLSVAVAALSSVCALLWHALVRKDRRLAEVHDRQTEAFRENVALLSEVKTLLSVLIAERRS